MTKGRRARAPWWLRAGNAILAKVSEWIGWHEPAGPDCQICHKRLVWVSNPGELAGIWAHKDNTDHAPLVRWADVSH
jgi:hypothetical protein